MATIDTLKTYEVLKGVFTEHQAKAVVEVMAEVIEETQDKQREVLATKEDLANTKAEIIKWMFIFWVGQIGAILSILFLFFK